MCFFFGEMISLIGSYTSFSFKKKLFEQFKRVEKNLFLKIFVFLAFLLKEGIKLLFIVSPSFISANLIGPSFDQCQDLSETMLLKRLFSSSKRSSWKNNLVVFPKVFGLPLPPLFPLNHPSESINSILFTPALK